MEQNEKARYKKWFPFTTYDLDELNNRDIVFCFHHAGGSASVYRKWTLKKEKINFVCVELPGKGTRRKERFIENFEELVGPLVESIINVADDRNILFFGHSMGAAMAFYAAAYMAQNYGREPRKIVVAGRQAPNEVNLTEFKSYMDDDALIKELIRYILDEPWTSIPYGRPLANQLLRVVNNKGKDSPVGVPGELWIGGYGVAEGYVNEEKLTQERFVKIDGIRWYKTGDKAQYFQDGNVQFLGRLDDQVKVNGYRIELGEIENVIKRAECIDDAIAMTVETNGKKEIVAAVVEKYEKGNASHQVFMNEENPEYAEIQEIRKKVVAAFILKVYGNNVDSLTPNDNIVINSNGKVEQYWNVWLLINNVISHKDSDEYVLNLEIKNVLSDIWYMKLETQIPMVQELIRGTVSASNLLTNGYLSPEELLVQGSDTVIFLEHVTKVIKHDSKVAVLGARTGLAVEMLLNNNLDRNVELTLIDESAGMLKRAEERLRRYDVQFEYYHFEDGLLEKSLLGQFDFVIALGELHRYKNPLHGLHVANMLLKAKGQLLALEYEELDPMSIISSAILENGFSEYMRKRKNTALMTVDEWLTAFEESAFDDVMIKVYPTSSALFINANANKYKEYLKELEEYVRNSLVQYMLPQEFITFTWFPLSQNGKVDRKKIRQIVGNRKRTMVKNTDYVGVEREIAELWKEMLSVEDIGRNDNFFEIGGDSLLATQFVECLKQKYEIEMSLREIFNNAELDRVSKIIEEKIECNKQMIEGEI